jgi:hypothetical protein
MEIRGTLNAVYTVPYTPVFLAWFFARQEADFKSKEGQLRRKLDSRDGSGNSDTAEIKGKTARFSAFHWRKNRAENPPRIYESGFFYQGAEKG